MRLCSRLPITSGWLPPMNALPTQKSPGRSSETVGEYEASCVTQVSEYVDRMV